MVLRPTIEHPDLAYLVDRPAAEGDGVRLELGRDAGKPADFLQIDNNVSPAQAIGLENAAWHHLPGLRPLPADELGVYQERQELRHSDHLALTQLLITHYLLRISQSAQPLLHAPPVSALRRTRRQRIEAAPSASAAASGTGVVP